MAGFFVKLLLLLLLLLLLSVSAFDRKKHHVSPTMAPTNSSATPAPSSGNTTTFAPSLAPNATVTPNATIAPTLAPTHTATHPPSVAPSNSPTTAPTKSDEKDNNKRHWSFWSVLAKTIAWCILILLVFLAFGAFMSNRYRIYYFLRGVWYTFLGMDCTQRIWRKLTGRGTVDSGLNTIIFEDNPDMSDGLLLRESD